MTQITPRDLELLHKASTKVRELAKAPQTDEAARRIFQRNSDLMFQWYVANLPYQETDDAELERVLAILRASEDER